jgi:serine/threonine protein kinase
MPWARGDGEGYAACFTEKSDYITRGTAWRAVILKMRSWPTRAEEVYLCRCGLQKYIAQRYRVVSRLGEGGMGAVYLADDYHAPRVKAAGPAASRLKVLPANVAADPERMHRFVQEAKLASALTHPNVAYIYEIGEDQIGERAPISRHGIRGGRAAERSPGPRPLPLSELLSVGSQVADALDDAHSKGIVHRDIKPSNLMITPRGYVKVLDFGLAKLETPRARCRDETQVMTSAGVVMGTVAYMSPEQALGRDVDHRTDLFSLGVVLYEMAAARLPFPAPRRRKPWREFSTRSPRRWRASITTFPRGWIAWCGSAWRRIASGAINRRASWWWI